MFSSTENVFYGTVCVLAACLATLSLPIHLRAGNTGVVLMMFWCFIGLFNKGINALAFNHNVRLYWTFGCDISAVIERIWQLGLCCSSLCVLQKLESIASLRQAHTTKFDRRRRLFLDIAVGLGIPVLQIPLFFIVQDYRLDVLEDLGCSAPFYSSVPALFVFYLWRLLASVLCAVYAVLILRWFLLRRRQFTAALSSQHSSLSQAKYFRLYALAICEATFVSAGQLYLIFQLLQLSGLQPYPSWAQVHANFNRIVFVPMVRDGSNSSALLTLEVFRWFSLCPAIALFLFFGLTEEAKSLYFHIWNILKRFGTALRPRRRNKPVLKRGDTGIDSLDLEDLCDQTCKVSIVLHKETVIC